MQKVYDHIHLQRRALRPVIVQYYMRLQKEQQKETTNKSSNKTLEKTLSKTYFAPQDMFN